jgi:hypothetical protein
MHFEELVLGPLPSPRSGMHTSLLQNILDRALAEGMNPHFPEFTEDTAVPKPVSLAMRTTMSRTDSSVVGRPIFLDGFPAS